VKIGIIIAIICFSISCFAEADLSRSKVYRSISADVDASITLVPSSEENQFILAFKGFEHQIDGSAKLYRKVNESSNPADGHYFQLVGTNQVHLRSQGKETLVSGTLIPYLEVSLDGLAPIKMIFAYKADVYKAQKTQDQYRQFQSLLASGVEAKRALRQARESMLASCGGSAQLSFSSGDFSQKNIPGMAVKALVALQHMCEQDADYKSAVSNLNQIRLLSSPKNDGFDVQVVDGVLSVSFEAQSANLYDRALEALKNRL
jgi:hypothetical protein